MVSYDADRQSRRGPGSPGIDAFANQGLAATRNHLEIGSCNCKTCVKHSIEDATIKNSADKTILLRVRISKVFYSTTRKQLRLDTHVCWQQTH